MKTRFLLSLLLSCLMVTSAMAEDYGILTVNLKDGSKVQFILPVEQPTVDFANGHMKVSYVGNKSNGSETEDLDYVTFLRDEVENLIVSRGEKDEIRELPVEQSLIRFDLTRQGVVRVSGLTDNDRLTVVSIDGKQVFPNINRDSSEALVDLTSLPRGCYIVSVNKHFTFKLMKP